MTDMCRLLCLLKFWLCLMAMAGALGCSIRDHIARCAVRNLCEVPALPPNVTILDLNINNISKLHENSFNGLEAIQILLLSHQTTRLTIQSNAFRQLVNLTELNLGYNAFLHLEPGAFNGLINLQTLDLTQCNLQDSILSGDILRPLVSLEKLIVKENKIGKVRPASFFINMSRFHTLDVSHNWINSICEDDLWNGFQGKHFNLLKLRDIGLRDMNQYWSGWASCGNPFKNMSINVLDLSSNSFSVDMAVRFFRAIRGTKVHTLSLNYSSGMGKGLWYNNFKDPDNLTFKDLAESSLRVLDLSVALIFALPSSVFSSLSELEELSLASNKINQIQSDAFSGLQLLKQLNLSDNLLITIRSEMFQNLHNLQKLDLSRNNIKSLQKDSFNGLSNLLYLDLSDNSLQHVYSLAELPRIQELYLQWNKIKSLSGLLSQVRNTKVIDLRYNALSNSENLYEIFADLRNIRAVYFGGNPLSWCVFNQKFAVSTLNHLQILDLHNTAIQNLWLQGQCLDIFQKLHQLQVLFLHYNYMKSLPQDIFKGLISLSALDLSFNSLTYLPKDIFPLSLTVLDLRYNFISSLDPQTLGHITNINLAGNRFLCDCNIRDFQTWLNQTTVEIDITPEELLCAYPAKQRGIPLLQVTVQCT